MKEYVKPQVRVFKMEAESLMQSSGIIDGVGGAPGFDTSVSPDASTGTYYSTRPNSVWGLGDDD